MTVMGGCLVVEMGAPRRDDEGQVIEDEFSPMPIVMQYIKRAWKELTFYEKVIYGQCFNQSQNKVSLA